ncbi:MAG TPA: hypothetical protein VH599_22180 [Ktedonobacterales bacterium]
MTDVAPQNPKITRQTYNIPVVIESNDVLFSIRSDSLINALEVLGWLEGSNILNHHIIFSPHFRGLFRFTSARLMFVQPGLPRKIAKIARLPMQRKSTRPRPCGWASPTSTSTALARPRLSPSWATVRPD